jgi:hypothetical protein
MNDITMFRRCVSDQALVDPSIKTFNIEKLCQLQSEMSASMPNLSDTVKANIDNLNRLINYSKKLTKCNFIEQIDIEIKSTHSKIYSIEITPQAHVDSDGKAADNENETIKPTSSKKSGKSRWKRTKMFFGSSISYFVRLLDRILRLFNINILF